MDINNFLLGVLCGLVYALLIVHFTLKEKGL